jgi:hypothetical protein
MATEYRNNVSCQRTSAFVLGFNWHFPFEFTVRYPADGVSASLLHPPLPALPLKLEFVIERIHDQPAALTIESLPPLNHEKRRHG